MEARRNHVAQKSVRRLAALAAVTLAAMLIRIMEIDRWPLWSDEALTLIIAQWPYKFLFLAAVDPTPGLYYSLHKLILGPSVDAAAARSISMVCGVLLIPTIYYLAGAARVPALFSAALAALSFPLIDYSQEARAYSLLTLLVTLSVAFFVRWARSRRPFLLFATLLTALLAFYTHFASIFWIGPAVLAILWIGRRQAVVPLLLTAIMAVPELFRIAGFPADGFIWLAQATPLQAADTLTKMLLPFRPAAPWLLLVIVLAAWRGWVQRQRIAAWARANPGAAVAIGILVAVPLTAWLFGLVARPVFMTRTLLIGMPGYILAIAMLLKFERQPARFVVVGIYTLGLLSTGTTRQKEDWREVASRVGSEAILLCEPGQVVAMRHSTTGGNRLFLNRSDGLAEVGGEPWQRHLFVLMSDRRMGDAIRRGEDVDKALRPVWPVRSGRIVTPSQRPVTLAQALTLCRQDQAAQKARYIAD